MKKLFPIIIALLIIFNEVSLQAKANFPLNDSTYQEVIEFTHPNKKIKKSLFLKEGENVVIKTKNSSKFIRGKIEGFTKDGLIVKEQIIPIANIETIRKKSIVSFFLRMFSGLAIVLSIIMAIVLVLLNKDRREIESQGSSLGAAIILFLLILLIGGATISLIGFLLIGLTLGITSKYNHRLFNMKKWKAAITTKKLPKTK